MIAAQKRLDDEESKKLAAEDKKQSKLTEKLRIQSLSTEEKNKENSSRKIEAIRKKSEKELIAKQKDI